MNIYRVLLVILIAIVYTALFWGLPFFAGDGMEGVYMLHGLSFFCAMLVFTYEWLLERW